MQKVQARQIEDAFGVLSELAEKEYPIGISFKISRVYGAFKLQMEIIQKQRRKLQQKHMKVDDEGIQTTTLIDPFTFQDELDELLDQEVEFSFERLAKDELAKGKNFLFSDRGETSLRGFEDPVRVFEVSWRTS